MIDEDLERIERFKQIKKHMRITSDITKTILRDYSLTKQEVRRTMDPHGMDSYLGWPRNYTHTIRTLLPERTQELCDKIKEQYIGETEENLRLYLSSVFVWLDNMEYEHIDRTYNAVKEFRTELGKAFGFEIELKYQSWERSSRDSFDGQTLIRLWRDIDERSLPKLFR